MIRYSSVQFRMSIVLLLILAGFVYVGIRMYGVVISRHDELFEKAKARYTFKKVTKGIRGQIYDHSGKLLVANLPVYDICADPSIVPDEDSCRKTAEYIAAKCSQDPALLLKRLMDKEIKIKDKNGELITKKRQFVYLAKDVDFDLAQQMKKEVKEKKFKWVSFVQRYKRNYPKNELLANILGFTSIENDDTLAVSGLEKIYDKKMKSDVSVNQTERGRDGSTYSFLKMEHNPVNYGYNVYLTIREPIQAILEEELDKLMERAKPRAAYAVLADPWTGDIWALAQRPTYNPNDRKSMTPEGYRNRLADDVMEPGSIMKPFVVAAALDQEIIHPNDIIDCGQSLWYYEGKALHDSHPVGRVPVTEVIKQSSNIGTAKIAIMMGKERLDSALRGFGFGSRTGIPFKDSKGIFRPLNKWDRLSISRFCIGQGIAATPLQLVRGYCMLANGGYPVKLRLVDHLEGDGGKQERQPIDKGQCVFRNPATADVIRGMMKTVTEPGGTAVPAAVPGYYVASKTGTSEKFINGAYRKKYFASFCGFVPAHKPQFVLLVTCDEPQGGYYGGAVSGPSFSAIAERVLKYLRVPPDVPLDVWEAERAAMRKAVYEKRKKNDEELRLRREKRAQQAQSGEPAKPVRQIRHLHSKPAATADQTNMRRPLRRIRRDTGTQQN